MTPADGGTLVHFNHDGWASDEGPFPSSALTWGQLMDSLKSYVETGTGMPFAARHDLRARVRRPGLPAAPASDLAVCFASDLYGSGRSSHPSRLRHLRR